MMGILYIWHQHSHGLMDELVWIDGHGHYELANPICNAFYFILTEALQSA